jgi:hypothetical protein
MGTMICWYLSDAVDQVLCVGALGERKQLSGTLCYWRAVIRGADHASLENIS